MTVRLRNLGLNESRSAGLLIITLKDNFLGTFRELPRVLMWPEGSGPSRGPRSFAAYIFQKLEQRIDHRG